jgi:hypothetical protein
MARYDRLEVVVAVVAFPMFLLTLLNTAKDEAFDRVVGDPRLAGVMGLVAVAAAPFAFAIPSLRASFMGRYWKVPSTAYVYPRWVLRFLCGGLAGQFFATLAWAVCCDPRLLWLLPAQLLLVGAFCFGTWRRLRKPASNEFTVSWFPRRR